MKLQLLENALDSLKFGLNFYQKFLNFDNLYDDEISGYLKMAVICIHNSVELLSKNMLSDIK